MISLNTFLRKCTGNGIDFRRIIFVRRRQHWLWSDYFPVGKSRILTSRGSNTFRVSGTGKEWVCTPTAGDVELLGIALSYRGLVVVLGDGHDSQIS
jgi:hypothetical protein